MLEIKLASYRPLFVQPRCGSDKFPDTRNAELRQQRMVLLRGNRSLIVSSSPQCAAQPVLPYLACRVGGSLCVLPPPKAGRKQKRKKNRWAVTCTESERKRPAPASRTNSPQSRRLSVGARLASAQNRWNSQTGPPAVWCRWSMKTVARLLPSVGDPAAPLAACPSRYE